MENHLSPAIEDDKIKYLYVDRITYYLENIVYPITIRAKAIGYIYRERLWCEMSNDGVWCLYRESYSGVGSKSCRSMLITFPGVEINKRIRQCLK